ncbi:MAG: SDR family oxidoreductase [Deltaproteobacteria bacterium]|nr:SDR family oxidoreductase [Nannocystaceae bacterium]
MVNNPPFFVQPTELAGKRALVTGGSRGIGAEIVRRLLAAGASVVGSARTPVADFPQGATFLKGDVSSADGARALARATLEKLGGIDILINNAGAAQAYPGGIQTIDDEAWQNALDANYLAAVRLTNALLPSMVAQKHGFIVNISTGTAFIPSPAVAHYGAAKAALNAYSKSLATEVAPHGVRVVVLSPGNVTSPGADKIRDDLAKGFSIPSEALTAGIPLGRKGVPADIAELVGFLASDRGAWITGSNFIVDGGESPFVV